MTYQDIIIERRGHVAMVTLNRPERMNSMGGTTARASRRSAKNAPRISKGINTAWARIVRHRGNPAAPRLEIIAASAASCRRAPPQGIPNYAVDEAWA